MERVAVPRQRPVDESCITDCVSSFVVRLVSNLYSHDSQWPIRDNSVRKEKE